MKIIVGTDFTKRSTHAMNVAASLAGSVESPVTVIHSVEPGPIEFLEKPHIDRLRSELQAKLHCNTAVLRSTGFKVAEKLVLGSPHIALPTAAKRSNANLIVVASARNESPLPSLTGSVAERIAQNAAAPTLVVREDESWQAWARGERDLNVFVGYDFSASADAALQFAAKLQEIRPCRITVAYVTWPPNETMRFGIGGDPSVPGLAPEVQALLERDLKQKCDAVFGSQPVNIRIIPTWRNEDADIIEAAINEYADVIVVGTNQRTGLNRLWLGSVSRAILRHAPMNVSCTPSAENPPNSKAGTSELKRVLVPIDFPESSGEMISHAFNAVDKDGEVRFLHVLRPTGGLLFEQKKSDRRSRAEKSMAEQLRRLVPRNRRGIRRRVEVVEHQHPSIAISQAAERFDAHLICMGARTKSNLNRRLFGSTTKSVMRRSSRPVLIVKS